MRPAFGVLTPVTRNMYAPEEQATLEAAVRDGLIDALWVRDLPCAPEGDPDVGQGHDPFAHLAFLAAGHDRGRVGRHGDPASVGGRPGRGRSAGALRGRVVLGLGSGGKPPVSAALGVGDRSLEQFIREWSAIWRALRGDSPYGSTFALPHEYRPPPMWLASDDADKWAAVGETATGWLTFFASPRTLLKAYEDVVAARGDAPAVGVRLDLRLVPVSDQPTVVAPPVRGVVTCSLHQLGGAFRPMRNLPVGHLLLNLVGDHAGGLRHVHEVWHGRFG